MQDRDRLGGLFQRRAPGRVEPGHAGHQRRPAALGQPLRDRRGHLGRRHVDDDIGTRGRLDEADPGFLAAIGQAGEFAEIGAELDGVVAHHAADEVEVAAPDRLAQDQAAQPARRADDTEFQGRRVRHGCVSAFVNRPQRATPHRYALDTGPVQTQRVQAGGRPAARRGMTRW